MEEDIWKAEDIQSITVNFRKDNKKASKPYRHLNINLLLPEALFTIKDLLKEYEQQLNSNKG